MRQLLSFLLFAGTVIHTPLLADTISNNLASASGGTEAAAGSNWLAASFKTSDSSTLQDVVLSLANATGGGSANVSIYSDDGLYEPGSLLATLSSSAALTPALAPVTWTSSSLPLSANSTYWVVLSALTGEVDWSYAADDSGSGAGFTDTWAASYDSAGSWYVYASLQNAGVDALQMSVETASAAAPEPGTAALCLLLGGLTLAAGTWTNSRKVGR